MARSHLGRRLTEQQRLAQVRLGQLTVVQMHRLWRLLDAKELDATVAAWLDAAVRLVQQQYHVSAAIARTYYQAIRIADVGSSLRGPLPTVEFNDRPTQVSLMVTGPVRIQRAMRNGDDLARAMRVALADSASAAMMRVLEGGRDTLLAAVDADQQALGYARAASPNACAFCLMLASRGPVYGADTADFPAHGACACTAEPVFARDQEWPTGSREARDLWDSTDGGLNEFRKALEGGSQDAADPAA